MKVTVTQGIHVVHDGKVYQDGQRVDVAERVARLWITYGWATRAARNRYRTQPLSSRGSCTGFQVDEPGDRLTQPLCLSSSSSTNTSTCWSGAIIMVTMKRSAMSVRLLAS